MAMEMTAHAGEIGRLYQMVREVQDEVRQLRLDLQYTESRLREVTQADTRERVRQASQELLEMIMWDTHRLDAIEEHLNMPLYRGPATVAPA